MTAIPRRSASPLWLLAAATTLAAALFLAGLAWVHQRAASRPIGEGALFLRETSAAAAGYDPAADQALEVRRIRNALGIEAVGVVDAAGAFRAATSDSLLGTTVTDPFLGRSITQGAFAAIAAPTAAPIALDGVVEWPTGAVLYGVVHPLPEGGALVFYYDISELLGRRAARGGIRPLTLQASAGAGLLLLLTLALLSARASASRRIRAHAAETARLAERAAELEALNRQLDQARSEAERALALAEETNRIRSDFVMMINHELRTPLTSLVTGTELLSGGVVAPDERDALLGDMHRDGKRLMSLIANILAVARIENRGLDYRLRPAPVGAVLGGIADITTAATVEFTDASVVAHTDPDGLVHLLVSLAENARTHGAGRVAITVGEPPPRIPDLLVGSLPGSPVYLRVEDDGPGIDLTFLPHAFEKFEKSSFSPGTGLGLYVARLMAEAIEAAILVHTGPQGTVMTVAVPRAAAGEVAA